MGGGGGGGGSPPMHSLLRMTGDDDVLASPVDAQHAGRAAHTGDTRGGGCCCGHSQVVAGTWGGPQYPDQ